MPDIVCDIPEALDHDKARTVFKQVKKEMPGLQESQYRREAARRLNVPYEVYLQAWKKPGASVRPKPGPAPAPKTLPDAPEPRPPVHTEPPGPSPVAPTRETSKPLRTVNEGKSPTHGTRVMRGDVHVGYIKKVGDDWQIRDAHGTPMHMYLKSRVEAMEKLDRMLKHRVLQGIPEGQSAMTAPSLRQRMGSPLAPPKELDLSRDYQRRPMSPSVADDYDHADLTDRGIQALADTRSTNPLYGTNSVAYGMNCVHVVAAHELRRRGWDVVASRLPKEFGRNGRNAQSAIERGWRTADGRTPVMRPATNTGLEATLLRELPDGGRAWVRNVWSRRNGGGHIFNVERVGDEIRVYEAQSGSMKTLSEYMARSKMDVYWLRTDTLVPVDGVKEFIEDGVAVRAKAEKAAARKKAQQESKLAGIYWRSLHPGETMMDNQLRLQRQPTPPADWDWRAYEEARRVEFARVREERLARQERERNAERAQREREEEELKRRGWWSPA